MSIQVKMYVDGQVFNLKRFGFGFDQNTNHDGLPCSTPKQKGVYGSTNMVKSTLFEEWAFADRMKKDVEIHMVHNITGRGRTRILKCYDCFLVDFDVDYDTFSTEVATNHFVLMCGAIEASWSTTIFVEDAWGKLPTKEEPTTVIEDEELILESAHYEDENGQKIEELDNGKVYLVINTQNGIGKLLDMDLSNREHDFKYNGKYLENDILRDISLKGDTTRVLLEVIDEQNTETT